MKNMAKLSLIIRGDKMAYIYKIINNNNGLVYIGITTRTVEARWKEHCRHSSQQIDKAIQEEGINNFTIETIEECPEDILDEREKYWINFFDSFNNGYNNTLGGRDNNYIMSNKFYDVIELWKKGLTIKQIVDKTKLNVETVRSYLNKSGIHHDEIQNRANKAIGKSKSKPVVEYSIEGEYIREWTSALDAAEFYNINSRFITATCRGHQKTYNNRRWKYLNDNQELAPLISKRVEQYSLEGELINSFVSIGEASRQTGIDRGSISKACTGKLKTAGKYKWRFTE